MPRPPRISMWPTARQSQFLLEYVVRNSGMSVGHANMCALSMTRARQARLRVAREGWGVGSDLSQVGWRDQSNGTSRRFDEKAPTTPAMQLDWRATAVGPACCGLRAAARSHCASPRSTVVWGWSGHCTWLGGATSCDNGLSEALPPPVAAVVGAEGGEGPGGRWAAGSPWRARRTGRSGP